MPEKNKSYTVLFLLFSFLAFLTHSEIARAEKWPVLDSAVVAWGAVGHNDRQGAGMSYPYNSVSMLQQLSLLQQAGMKSYRTGCGNSSCGILASMANHLGMVFLRALEIRPDARLSERDNYKRGYDYALEEGRKYKGIIHFYEASNELDNWVGMTGDGATRNQYNATKYPLARSFIKGLIDGIHAADSNALVAVNNAGWCHYGFMQALWDDGIRWDITAVHWYASQGDIEKAGCRGSNVTKILSTFGKPVWITEFNSNTAAQKADANAAAQWLVTFAKQITAIAPKYNIQAAFIYELFDEPNTQGMERYFGIASSTGKPKKQYQAVSQYLLSLPKK